MNIFEDRKNKLLNLISEVQIELSKEIENFKEPNKYEIQHLIFIGNSLEELRSDLLQSNTDNIRRKSLNISRIIIDEWPFEDLLGKKICEIEYEFERVKKHLNRTSSRKSIG